MKVVRYEVVGKVKGRVGGSFENGKMMDGTGNGTGKWTGVETMILDGLSQVPVFFFGPCLSSDSRLGPLLRYKA